MTDETTARDRAIKDMTVALTPYLGDRIFGLPQTPDAVLAAVWPLVERYAQDEVLRALAASPATSAVGDALEILGDDNGRIDLSAIAGELGELRAEVSMLRSENRRLAAPERDAARAEVQVLRRDVVQHEATIRYLVAERERARARDEAAKAAVQWWREIGSGTPTEKRLRARLDALARAHETGGQDR